MGIFDFLKNEFIEVIDWVESDPNVVFYKFPDQQADIKYGAALTVRPSQTAIFVNEGEIADIFSEGLYALETQNLPVLTKLRNWDKGFKSPFKCDIYFISLKQFTQFKWGTPNPLILRDQQFGQVRVKAFGTYMVKIKDPVLFFKQYSGNRKIVYQSDIEERFEIRTLAPMEIFAAKTNALISRAAARDLYDFNNMVYYGLFDSDERP